MSKKTIWILVAIAAVVGVGVVLWMATRTSSAPPLSSGDGAGGTAAGVINTVGAGVTSIASAIAGAAESENGDE